MVERKTFNLVVVGSIPTVGVVFFLLAGYLLLKFQFSFFCARAGALKNAQKQTRRKRKSKMSEGDPTQLRPSGLEPESSPWKGEILPLYYGRREERRIVVRPHGVLTVTLGLTCLDLGAVDAFALVYSKLAQRKRVGHITHRS